MTVQAIQDAILALPEQGQIELEEWLAGRWDAQMERDFSPGGRGAKLIERVDAEIDGGQFRPLDPR
ncbi:MAG TPA: hypothetical protein VKX39_02115 [Bryobacteraceae bacterium]|jgi:hypothetical protein|nr:hypothetical protein [Bryobacteraceae bacterium]